MLSKLFVAAFAALSLGLMACDECGEKHHRVSFDDDADHAPVDVSYEGQRGGDHVVMDAEGFEIRSGEAQPSFTSSERFVSRDRFVSGFESYEPMNKYSYTKPAVAARLEAEEDHEYDRH
jgi:hypothetical protein